MRTRVEILRSVMMLCPAVVSTHLDAFSDRLVGKDVDGVEFDLERVQQLDGVVRKSALGKQL